MAGDQTHGLVANRSDRDEDGGLGSVGRALESRHTSTLQRAAHTLKSNAANFGASQLEERSRTLEAALRTGDPSGAAGMVQSVRESWLAVRSAVEALTAE